MCQACVLSCLARRACPLSLTRSARSCSGFLRKITPPSSIGGIGRSNLLHRKLLRPIPPMLEGGVIVPSSPSSVVRAHSPVWLRAE